MPGNISKENIVQQLEMVSKELSVFCSGIEDKLFFQQPTGKWSIAQNINHLIKSADLTILVFSFPKFVVRLYMGKPNRPSRTYDELVAKYKLKLEQGGRAGGRFIPKPVTEKENKERILYRFLNVMNRLDLVIQKKWNDLQLDQYIAPHPLLGKITLRELCYFTIYHTRHHLNIIRQRLGDYNKAL
jgi:DinB superfamily